VGEGGRGNHLALGTVTERRRLPLSPSPPPPSQDTQGGGWRAKVFIFSSCTFQPYLSSYGSNHGYKMATIAAQIEEIEAYGRCGGRYAKGGRIKRKGFRKFWRST